jgi:hypothetical protein
MEPDPDKLGAGHRPLLAAEDLMDIGTYQVSRQILVDAGAPPVIASIFWLMARGWVASIGSGEITILTKQKLKIEFRIVLVFLYLAVFGETLYSLLT